MLNKFKEYTTVKTVFFKLLSITISAVAVLLVVLYCFQYIPAQKKLLRSALFEKVKTVFSLSGPTLTKALQTRDDIMMLSAIESIMKIEDINTVYILDNGGKVITHDKTAEWGKTYTDEQSKNAVNAKKIIRQSVQYGFLFSEPITSSATLCVGLSSQKYEESVSSLNKEAFFTGLIIFIIAAAGFILLIQNTVFIKLKKLNVTLSSLALGGSGKLPEEGQKDEFGRLTKLINEVLDNRGSSIESGNKPREENSLGHLLRGLTDMNPAAVVVIGSNNNIIALNRKAAGLMGITAEEAQGKHILDVIKLTEILSLIKQVSEKPQAIAEASFQGKKAKAVSTGEGVIIEII
jgi:PAS domain S-box-containing protein